MRALPCFSLLSSLALFACSSQTFDVGGFDGGTGGDGGDTGSDGGTGAASIDPLAVGNSWTYQVTVTGTYPACSNGSGTATVSDHQSYNGKDAYLVSSFCPSLGSYWYSPDGDRIYEYVSNAWIVAIDSPVLDGHTWTGGTETFVWKKIGSVTVVAGTFSDCWEIDDQAAPTYYNTTLCRGVGPVKWHYRDASQNGYDAELTSKSF